MMSSSSNVDLSLSCTPDVKLSPSFIMSKRLETKLYFNYRSGVKQSPSYPNNSVWYLDIGVRNHKCGDENLFKELSKVEVENVSFGDDSKVAVKGEEQSSTCRRMAKLEKLEKCTMYRISKSLY